MKPSPLARYLLAAYALLVAYASLYPFTGWRDQGVAPFAFLLASVPRYVTAFDIAANFFGYLPLGFLAALAAHPRLRGAAAASTATAGSALLGLGMEALQTFLPARIPSNIDVLANGAGALVGAVAATVFAQRLLRDEGLHALRYRLFHPGGKTDFGLLLLGLWLFSQLNPATLLFGNGDLRELFREVPSTLHPAALFIRVEATVAGANALALAMLATCLLRAERNARILVVLLLAAALAARTLAFGVLLSPNEALAWLTPGAALGIAAGTLVALIAQALPQPARLAAGGLALMLATAVVNLSPENPYLSASIAAWRQGQFLNFNGLTRLVSALWPFVALGYLITLAAERARSRE